ncbi:MAG: sulfotransferase family protein [Thermodesulfobacteriota bacterium]
MVLLIVGHIRSGTTLLRNLCDSHPEIALTNEFKYFSGLDKTYREHSLILLERLWEKTRIRKKFVWHLHNYSFVAHYLFEMHRYRKWLIDVAAIESVLRSIFPKARIAGDKTPCYVFSLDKFVATNGLYCLIIFRDYRDVTSSTLEKVRTQWRNQPTQHIDTAEKVVKRWVQCIELMERHKDKIHIIRYEDLVREPRKELEALAKWLEVDATGFSEHVIRRISNSSIGKYKTGLTDEELKTVIEIAGPTMARLGYL